jgi:DNA-binding NarL/FixJ family response regulator
MDQVKTPPGPSHSGPIRIAFIDDDEDVLRLVEAALIRAGGFAQPLTFKDPKTAFRKLARRELDVVLVDLNIPGDSGIRMIRRLVESRKVAYVIAFSAANDEASILEALRVGAKGYWDKAGGLDGLIEAMRKIWIGGALLSPAAYQVILSQVQSPPRAPKFQLLSRAETTVLSLAAEGLSCAEIASRLQISIHTVYVHNKKILKKLGVGDRLAAIARFRDQAERRGNPVSNAL